MNNMEKNTGLRYGLSVELAGEMVQTMAVA